MSLTIKSNRTLNGLLEKAREVLSGKSGHVYCTERLINPPGPVARLVDSSGNEALVLNRIEPSAELETVSGTTPSTLGEWNNQNGELRLQAIIDQQGSNAGISQPFGYSEAPLVVDSNGNIDSAPNGNPLWQHESSRNTQLSLQNNTIQRNFEVIAGFRSNFTSSAVIVSQRGTANGLNIQGDQESTRIPNYVFGGEVVSPSGTPQETWRGISVRRENNTDMTIRVDEGNSGVKSSTNDTAHETVDTQIGYFPGAGGSSYTNSSIGAVIILDNPLSALERSIVEGYVSQF